MTSPSSWYALARECRMRAAEARARADEMKEVQPKAIMLRIAADFEELAEWAEENSIPWWDKSEVKVGAVMRLSTPGLGGTIV